MLMDHCVYNDQYTYTYCLIIPMNCIVHSKKLKLLIASAAALVASFSPLIAQSTTRGAAEDGTDRKESPILLSKFEVTSTQGHGYTSNNAATGFKTNEELMRIPQAVTLVTRDLINDIGAVDSSNILRFAGVSNFFAGESFALRGTRINYPLLDEMPDGVPYADNINLDSYTVLRGPAATLYLNAALGGTVLTTSKTPLPNEVRSVTGKVTDYGTYRIEGDFTGPLFAVGDAKVSYRVTTALQEGDSYFKNVEDHRKVIHPTLQLNYKNTVVRVAYDYQQLDHVPNGNSFVTPTGELYTGAGRDEAYYVPGSMESFHRRGVRGAIIQKLADNWDMKIAGTTWWFSRYGSVVFPSGGINWPAQTMTFNSRKNDQKFGYTIGQIDINGKYHIGSISAQSTFGASYSESNSKNRILSYQAGIFPSRTVPISSPNLNSFSAPDPSLPTAGNPTGGNSYVGNYYFQQTADVIPDRLTLVVGLTRSKIKNNSISNLITGASGQPVAGKETLHRYGIVFNVTKEVALYAMESTTFAPAGQRDINLNLLPSVQGKAHEAGFKTSFMDGRFSSTFAVFKLKLTNQSFFAGVRPDGISYFAPIGTTTQEGFDFDLTYTPRPGLQFIGAYYHGRVRDQTGADVANSYSEQYSLVGRYEFQSENLKGLSVGAGFARLSGRLLSVGAYVTGIAGLKLIEVEPSNELTLFASYKLDKNWSFRLNVDNALDEAYVLGAQNAYFVDPSLPRSFSASATYKF